tara:strand:+ start:4132 stop:4524 length:393 start_codon:yes stop_codon:yes gene_type:complete
MHRLTNSLDQAFDSALRHHANISLSQFTLLLAVQHFGTATQRAVATFLDISPAAVSRQVDIAANNGRITIVEREDDRRTHQLQVTTDGKRKITDGITTLEEHVFAIFRDENQRTNLMDHIETLQKNIDRL